MLFSSNKKKKKKKKEAPEEVVVLQEVISANVVQREQVVKTQIESGVNRNHL